VFVFVKKLQTAKQLFFDAFFDNQVQSFGRNTQCHVICMFLVRQITYLHATNWHRQMLDGWRIASNLLAWRNVRYHRQMSVTYK
jgi:hypothetical protein